MSVLIILVVMTTHVSTSMPVAFVVVRGDDITVNKTQHVSIGKTAPTQKHVKTGIGCSRTNSLGVRNTSVPSDNDEK